MLRRIGVLASLAVVAAMFMGVTSANAAVGDAGVCVFDGLSGTLNPSIPGIANDPGLIDVERGSYNFHTGGATGGLGAVCAGAFGGSLDVGPVTINSDGYYDNILCGTGFAHDLDGAQTTIAGTGVLGTSINISGAGYEIPFVAGVGPLLIGPGPSLAGLVTPGTHAGASGADATHGAKSSDWAGAGLVQIAPVNATTGGCVIQDVSEFEVRGLFVGAGIG